MVSTFTPNLNLQCQGVSDNSNTWGNILNAAVFTNIDQALGGSFPISVAGGSDYTLSQANAQNIEHIISGLITANINYIFPVSAGRIVKITNNTTGAFTITVKQLGGTGIVIPQGKSMFISLSAATTTASSVLTALGNSPSIGTPVGTSNGTAIGANGQINLFNAVNTNVTTIQSGTSTANWTMTLPTGPGANGQFFQTDGTGNTSWGTANAALPTIPNNFVLGNISGTSAVAVGTSVTGLLDSALGSSVGGLALRGTSTWGSLATGTATNLYLQAQGTNTIATWGTVAMTDPGSSLSQSGYQKMASGMILQWGKAVGGTCTFPLTFPNNVFSVVTSLATNVGSGDSTYFTVSSASTSQFVVVTSAQRYFQATGN